MFAGILEDFFETFRMLVHDHGPFGRLFDDVEVLNDVLYSRVLQSSRRFEKISQKKIPGSVLATQRICKSPTTFDNQNRDVVLISSSEKFRRKFVHADRIGVEKFDEGVLQKIDNVIRRKFI
jgi:hypothetical protein